MKAALAFLVALSLFLRFFYFPSHPSALYWDEMDVGYQAYSLLKTGKDYFNNPIPVHVHSFADYRTPLYIYLTVPLVELFGLNPFSVRLTSALMGLIGIAVLYVLSVLLLRLGKYSWLPAAVMALSPWHLHLSRIAFETTTLLALYLLGLAAFYRGFYRPRWFIISALGFGLSFWTYSPAKLFVPLTLLLLFIIYFRQIILLPRHYIFNSLILVFLLSFPILYSSTFGPASMRLRELLVFTDPVTSAEVDSKRQLVDLAAGFKRSIGMSPSLQARLVYNKLTFWGSAVLNNYVSSLSTEFLFVRGDPQPRHSPSETAYAQFHLIDLASFLFGLFALFSLTYVTRPHSRLIVCLLLLAPLSSVITRDGGTHSLRLIFLLPVVSIVIALGLRRLIFSKILIVSYLSLFFVSLFLFSFYYFTSYRSESFRSFNFGYSQAVRYALDNSQSYDRIFLDMYDQTALMAYMFEARPDPRRFQQSHPLQSEEIMPGLDGLRMGNIYILPPGTRDWLKMDFSRLKGKNLVIADALLFEKAVHEGYLQTLFYPDSRLAFYIFTTPTSP